MPRTAVVPQVLDRIDASYEGRGQLAERRERPVLGAEGERRPDLGGLLALERRIDRQLALPLERHALAIEEPRAEKVSEQLAQLVGVEAHVRIADGRAVGRQDADRFRAGPVRGRIHLHSRVEDAESIGDEVER